MRFWSMCILIRLSGVKFRSDQVDERRYASSLPVMFGLWLFCRKSDICYFQPFSRMKATRSEEQISPSGKSFGRMLIYFLNNWHPGTCWTEYQCMETSRECWSLRRSISNEAHPSRLKICIVKNQIAPSFIDPTKQSDKAQTVISINKKQIIFVLFWWSLVHVDWRHLWSEYFVIRFFLRVWHFK